MRTVEVDTPYRNQIETRRITATPQAGESLVGAAAVTAVPLYNLLVDPGWFFPEHLAFRATTSTRPATLVPAASMDGTTAVGVDSYLTSAQSHSATMRQVDPAQTKTVITYESAALQTGPDPYRSRSVETSRLTYDSSGTLLSTVGTAYVGAQSSSSSIILPV